LSHQGSSATLAETSAGPARDEDTASNRPRGAESEGSFGAVLRNGSFLRLWLAQVVSQTANSMVDFSLLLRVGEAVSFHQVSQANTAVSFVILAFSLPSLVFGPIAGAVADRVSRRIVMAVVNGLRAALVVLFLLVRPDWPVQIALGGYYLIAFLFGGVGQFFMPAQGASIPSLVPREQLTAANALFNLTFTATQLLGFAILGPLLAQALGVDVLFLVMIGAFALSAVLTLTLPAMPPTVLVREEDSHPMKRIWADVKEGLNYIVQDPILMKAIAYLTFATTVFMLIAALAPNFVSIVVGLHPNEIGYIVAPAGLGVIVGVVLVPTLSARFRRDALVDWAVIIGGAALLLLAMSREILFQFTSPQPVPQTLEIVVAGALAALLGICNALVLVPSQTTLQERSHEHIRARVYGTFFTITSVVSFVPIFFAAAIADLLGVVKVLAAVAVALMIVGGVSLLRDRGREQELHERVPARGSPTG
jgi:MFS family permease